MNSIKIKYNNKIYEYNYGISLNDIAKDFQNDFKHPILIAKGNGALLTLNSKICEDTELVFYDMSSPVGAKIYERSTIFILTKAVKDLFDEDIKIEHSIDKGICCHVDLINEEKVNQIKNKMIEIAKDNIDIEKLSVNRMKMIKYFKSVKRNDNAELLKYLSNSYVTIYKLGNKYDYFYGPMVISTGYIKDFNLKYIGNDRFVLMLPNRFENCIVNEYIHHEKFYNSVMEYIRWTNSIGARNFTDINKKLSDGK